MVEIDGEWKPKFQEHRLFLVLVLYHKNSGLIPLLSADLLMWKWHKFELNRGFVSLIIVKACWSHALTSWFLTPKNQLILTPIYLSSSSSQTHQHNPEEPLHTQYPGIYNIYYIIIPGSSGCLTTAWKPPTQSWKSAFLWQNLPL